MNQPKVECLLRLMKMLTANNSLTVDEIADKLGISSRSVYRKHPRVCAKTNSNLLQLHIKNALQ